MIYIVGTCMGLGPLVAGGDHHRIGSSVFSPRGCSDGGTREVTHEPAKGGTLNHKPSFLHTTVEPRYNNEHRAFNSYSYNEVIAISNQGLSDHVPHHL
jgi:hypothetical protein